MPELVRDIVARVRGYFNNRRYARRYALRLPATVALHDPKQDEAGRWRGPALVGVTRDLSATGLALVLPTVRVGARYLAGAGQTLRVSLEQPTGPLEFLAKAIRYEHLDAGDQEEGYLIGAHITEIAPEAQARLIRHLQKLEK